MTNETKRAEYWLKKAEDRLDDGHGTEISWIDAMRHIAMGNAWTQLAIARAAIQRNNNRNAIMPEIASADDAKKRNNNHGAVIPVVETLSEERVKGYIGDYHHATDRATTRESGKAD